MKILPNIVVDFGDAPYLEPYFERLFIDQDIDPKDWPAPCTGIKIATDEHDGVFDPDFEKYCDEGQIPVVALRCPYIVGTGMQGLLRRIAAGVYRGTYVNILGNEAKISLAHATDVARAAQCAMGCQGTYTLTDQRQHTISELATSLGVRMSGKRVFTVKPRWARWWLGSKYYRTLTTDHVAADTFADAFPDFKPVDVIDYLQTHVYDQESL